MVLLRRLSNLQSIYFDFDSSLVKYTVDCLVIIDSLERYPVSLLIGQIFSQCETLITISCFRLVQGYTHPILFC